MAALLAVLAITEAGTPPARLRSDELVEDVEALVDGVIGRSPTTRSLSGADRDLLRDALFERVVILTRKYDRRRDDPRQKAALAFRPWLFRELQRDAIDELRSWHGRRGEKRVADPRHADGDGLYDGDPPLDRPEAVAAFDEDPARRARALPGAWTDAGSDRPGARAIRGLGLDAGSEAA